MFGTFRTSGSHVFSSEIKFTVCCVYMNLVQILVYQVIKRKLGIRPLISCILSIRTSLHIIPAPCCNNSVVVLSLNGRVFFSKIESNGVLNFSIVSVLSGQEIVCVSGTKDHFLAVSKEGLVFGRGSNENGKLCLGEETKSVSSFTKISSHVGYEIRAAYAGCGHSLFETREGKVLSYGSNNFGELLLSSDPS